MIIGISGKIGSGKDTVGKIIQYLTHPQIDNITIGEWLDDDCKLIPVWKIKKFAGKLKQIVSIITGIPVEDLENQEVKDKILGEEWNRYLLKEHWINDEYAEHEQYIYFSTKNDMEKYISSMGHTDSTCSQVGKQSITVRQILQECGTEAMRDVIHPNIWCTALFVDYKNDVEKWKDIIGYEGKYQISSFGNVKSLDRKIIYGDSNGEYHTRKGQILTPTLSGNYLTVSLSGTTFTVHQLVAKHFVQGYAENKVVNHIDYNCQNNFYKNLEWISQKENILHNYTTGNANIGIKQKDAKLNDNLVLQIKYWLLSGKYTNAEIAKRMNVSPTTITDIKKGRKWKHVGKEKVVIEPIVPNLSQNWVITDVRFPNELEAVKNRGGITIRVVRPGTATGTHPSETSLDFAEFDYTIINDSSIEDLIEKVREILYKEQFNNLMK